MARDFDNFPTYDPVIKEGSRYLSSIWADFMATFVESLQGYLSQNGIFIPVLTTEQRDEIQNPEEGQFIYLRDETIGPPRTAAIQVWQVKADLGAWRTFTTTP
jgi:hypothetical protein